ncbi:hypothetical protein HMPREF1531_01281 [Propionibacterium sp. oral taxon 192 str. F0372]|nr:hypothetical protein HMPREF1531_01281 [Propionibacterium sp. oral taxon 192 str. F0372]
MRVAVTLVGAVPPKLHPGLSSGKLAPCLLRSYLINPGLIWGFNRGAVDWASRILGDVNLKFLMSKPKSLALMAAISVLAGVLTAGLVLPFVALGTGAIRASTTAIGSVPTSLSVPQQNEASTLLMGDGSELAKFYDQNRSYVPLDQISKEMQNAQISIEDHRFYEHGAIDAQSVLRALVGNVAGGSISGGGSTLTQQYVKQVRIQLCYGDATCEAEAQAATMERKILEMRYAIALEKEIPKDVILERYLNIAYYGDGAYGVQAAAKHYFNVNASQLDLAQSAMLAGLVQNPSQTDPVNYPEAAIARRAAVLDSQIRYQGLSQEQAEAAKAVPFDTSQVQEFTNGCSDSRYPFVCDYALKTLESDQMTSLGATPRDRRNTLNRGGLTITVTVDPGTQDNAQRVISSVIGAPDPVIAVADTVEVSTGRIVSMVQSRPQWGDGDGKTNYNYSVTNAMGGAEGFMFGSTFKIWTAAAGIQQGNYPDSTSIRVAKSQNWRGKTFRGCGDNTFTLYENYTTTNAVGGQDKGSFNMVTGMMWSVNNYWIALEQRVGPCQAADMAQRAGVQLAKPEADAAGFGDELSDWGEVPSFTLGAPYVTPLSMAASYATFGNRGVRCNPIILSSITNRDGVDVPVPSADCQQTIDPTVADGVNYVMKATQERGLSAQTWINNGIDQGSKTGTSDNSASSSAFVGYTPYMSTAIVVAGDTSSPGWQATNPASRNVLTMPLSPLGGGSLGGYNGIGAGAFWKPIMQPLLAGREPAKFNPWQAPSGR